MDQKEKNYPLALKKGTVLYGQYIINKVLGQGGFGITYQAADYKTKKYVAVKEYFPDTLAYRDGNNVCPHPGERAESFEYGKKCFLQEAETLAKFIGNESVVRIYSYFEENGTAYFVMEYVDGTSFDVYIQEKGGKISIDDAERILFPVMDAMEAVHSKGIIHRDLTPDNIYITKDNKIKLLDFGAARYSIGDKSRSLDVVLKHGFAPKEQYTRRGKQGPFTDIYSLGATYYFALTGKRPPDSVDRLEEDDLIPPSSLGVKIDGYKEDAILHALNPQPSDRYQSMSEFKNALLNKKVTPAPVQSAPVQQPIIEDSKPYAPASVQPVQPQPEKKSLKWLIPVIAAGVMLIAAIILFVISRTPSDDNKPNNNILADNNVSNNNSSGGSKATYELESNDSNSNLKTQNSSLGSKNDVIETTLTPLNPTSTPLPTATPLPTSTPIPTPTPINTGISTLSRLLTDRSVGWDTSGYIIYESQYRYITYSDLYGLTADECKLARNEIYARHGRKFKDKTLQKYFNSQSWYYGYIEPDNFKEEVFNIFEKANIQFIKDYESSNLANTYQYYSKRPNPQKVISFKTGGGYYFTTVYLFINSDKNDLMYIECDDENEGITYYGSASCYIADDGTITIYNSSGYYWRTCKLDYITDSSGDSGYKLDFSGSKWYDTVYDEYVVGNLYDSDYYYRQPWG